MRILGIGFCLLLSACSTPMVRPPVELYPATKVVSSSVGNQQPVFVTVADARNQNSYSNANINSSQSITKIMTQEISQGLQKQGFNPVNVSSGKQNELDIKLVTLDYRALSGYVSSNTQTFVSAEVTAKNAAGSTFTKTYNATAYNDSYVNVSSQTPSSQVNQAFDKLLNNILNDSSLIQFLVKP